MRKDAWTIVAKSSDVWAIQIHGVEPETGMLCVCEETGGVYRVGLAGIFDHKAHAAGKRIVRFYPISGEDGLEEGFQMLPRV